VFLFLHTCIHIIIIVFVRYVISYSLLEFLVTMKHHVSLINNKILRCLNEYIFLQKLGFISVYLIKAFYLYFILWESILYQTVHSPMQ